MGGRIFQERLPNGHLVDIGANWIHGTTDNPIMDLVRETNTAVGTGENHSYIYDEDGQILPLEDGDKYSTLMWKIIEDAFEYSNKHGAEIDPERSLLDFFLEQVPKRIPDTEDDHEMRRRILLQMAGLWGNFVGSPIRSQSLKFFWLEECIEGGKPPKPIPHDFRRIVGYPDLVARKPLLRGNVQQGPGEGCPAGHRGCRDTLPNLRLRDPWQVHITGQHGPGEDHGRPSLRV